MRTLDNNFPNNKVSVKPIFTAELIKIHILFVNVTFSLTSISRILLSPCDLYASAKIFKFSEQKRVPYVLPFFFNLVELPTFRSKTEAINASDYSYNYWDVTIGSGREKKNLFLFYALSTLAAKHTEHSFLSYLRARTQNKVRKILCGIRKFWNKATIDTGSLESLSGRRA